MKKIIIEHNNQCSRCNKFSYWKPDQCARHYQSELQCCTAHLHKIWPSKWFHLILSIFQTIHICCIVTWCQMQLCRSSMIYFINFIFSQHKLEIAKLSHSFSHQFDTVLFYNFRNFEFLSATNLVI